ncbi:MAG: carboxypeptidase regulatory-like domain-containing protein [Terriglobia bacterium]
MKPTLFASVFFLLTPPLAAQQPVTSTPEKCRVEGLVVKAGTGEPLKKAQVVLRNAEGREKPYGTITDATGRFLRKDIEPGRYHQSVARNGYVRQQYGQRRPGRPGTILALAPGQHLRDIVFRLIPAAVITGRVYDEDGEAVPGVRVQALRYRYRRGQRQLLPAGQAASNDLGEYRLYGLAPGQYHVSATYTRGLRWITGGGAIGSDESAADEGYAPTYYPGTTDAGRAIPVAVRSGDEVRAIDFTLLPTRTVRLRGRVFNAITGRPGRGAMLRLMPRESGVWGGFGSRESVQDAEGAFEIRGVRPGSYTLLALWFYDNKRYSARVPLEVGTRDIEGINLVISRGVELAGRLRVEGFVQPLTSAPRAGATQSLAQGKTEGQLELTEVRVSLQPRDPTPMGGASASVKVDGTFVLQNVAQDDYRIRVWGAPRDFYLKAARLGGDDVLEEGLSVSGGQPPDSLELLLSPGAGRIDGQVWNEDQQPFSGALVVLVPEPRRRDQAHLYKSGTTDQNGRFTLRGIRPGDYKLFAWEEVEPGAYQDAHFLRSYEERGKPVRVDEAGRLSVQLELISADQRPR